MKAMDCAELSTCAAELSLGILSGPDRARALLHLERCLTCRAEIQQLAATCDALLELAPTAEPPLGFESRVVARLAGSDRRRRHRWRAAAAAAALLLAGLGGWALGSSSAAPAPRATAVASGDLVAGSRVIGRVLVDGRAPTWVVMSVDGGGTSGNVTCVLTERSGRVVRLGRFHLTDGYGTWSATVAAGPAQLVTARLVADDGTTIARARLRPS